MYNLYESYLNFKTVTREISNELFCLIIIPVNKIFFLCVEKLNSE